MLFSLQHLQTTEQISNKLFVISKYKIILFSSKLKLSYSHFRVFSYTVIISCSQAINGSQNVLHISMLKRCSLYLVTNLSLIVLKYPISPGNSKYHIHYSV